MSALSLYQRRPEGSVFGNDVSNIFFLLFRRCS